MMILTEMISSAKKKNTVKKESFIIVNTDKKGGHYIYNIANALVQSGLQQQDARFGGKQLKKIKLHDAVIVGDCDSVFDYDYRVVKNNDLNESLEELDGRTFKVYDSVRDLHKILTKIDNYAKANNIGQYRYTYAKRRGCFQQRKPVTKAAPININVRVQCQEEAKPTFYKKNVSSYRRVDPIRRNEKVTFFSDWVKIGMNQFDIQLDCLGNEFIQDSTSNKYYITEDRYGARHLVVTR